MSIVISDAGTPEVAVDSADMAGISRQSERALDCCAFCLADVADGLGPFLVIYLTSQQHWTAGEAGWALSLMLMGTVISQTFTGAWIDQTRHKRLAVAVAATFVGLSSIAMYHFPNRMTIEGLQFVTGMVVTVFPPALAAISLGMVGRDRLPARAGRNEACFHAGNVLSALVAIVASWCCGQAGVFYGVALFAFTSAVSAFFIRDADIDHDAARGLDHPTTKPAVTDDTVPSQSAAPQSVPWTEILRDPLVLRFTLAVILFHFANAAMLPLVGQKAAHRLADQSSMLMGACIIVAQLTMVPVAIVASRYASLARKPVFLVALIALPIRGFLYTLTDQPAWLIANQILDGIGAGIFGVVALLMMADLTRGTGRFNFAQGLVATGIGLGAALSNYLTGKIVDHWGFDAGFQFLTGVALLAFILFLLTVPETIGLPPRRRLTVTVVS